MVQNIQIATSTSQRRETRVAKVAYQFFNMSFNATSFLSSAKARSLPSGQTNSPVGAWAVFDKAWTAAMGYPADEFNFIAGETPLSTVWETAGIIALYLIVIFGGREYMRDRKPLKLNGLFKIHNLFLTIVSGALLALFLEQLLPTLWRDGFYENICGADGWTPPLVTLYYVSIDKFPRKIFSNKFSSTTSRNISSSSTRCS